MPRGSTAAKRQQGAANHRDTRHENGLVGPGKRVQKQKSNGQLNGHTKTTIEHPATPPLPGTPPQLDSHVRQPLADTSDTKTPIDSARRISVSGDSEMSSAESYYNNVTVSTAQENHRRIDVNAAKNPAVHRDVGHLSFALTVLRSCPLYDTIAILIVLLQIPPTFLSLIHLLFASLTFVPPSSSVNSALSFTDIFEGNLGTPSVATIMVIDALVLMVWLFLWSPLQNVSLDLAQTVIALTLGGGTSGREAGMNNVLVCFGIIGVSHFARNGNVKQSGLRAILSSSSSLLGSSDPDDPLEPVSHGSKRQNAHGWVRSILAIHILTQGVVRYIRDWYVRREKRDSSASLGDPEAGKPVGDSNNEGTNNVSTPENEPTPPSITNAVLTAKKKKKQSAQVRIRQPLWSALASTKIVMVKEYETSHTAAESAGTNATDINNLGNAPFNTEADRIWITYVGSDVVYFSTSYFPTHISIGDEDKKVDVCGVDKSKPFFIRVNQAEWHQLTKISATTDPEQPAGQGTKWSGEIFGLAPTSSYTCEFISTVDGSVIFSTSIRTHLIPTADNTIAGLSPNPAVSGRPGSPTTTLKTTIASADIKLAEERNRQKREKKDQRAKLNSIRREIEKLTTNISSSGGSDDRLKQKIQQSNLHMKQAEEGLATLSVDIETFEALPTDHSSLYSTSKRQYQSERDQHKRLLSEFNTVKEALERDLQALQAEFTNIQSKHERLVTRLAKMDSERDQLIDDNAKGLDEAQRKEREQKNLEADRRAMENLYVTRLTTQGQQVADVAANLEALYNTISTLQQAELYAAHQAQMTASPNTSVPNLNNGYGEDPNAQMPMPGNYPWNPPSGANPTSMFSPFATHSPMMGLPPSNASPAGHRTRGRSSSMLSNVSGFTASSNEGAGPPQRPSGTIGPHRVLASSFSPAGPSHSRPVSLWEDAKDRQGSSSGSGSGSGSASSGSHPGSVVDPKSPPGVIGNGKPVSKW